MKRLYRIIFLIYCTSVYGSDLPADFNPIVPAEMVPKKLSWWQARQERKMIKKLLDANPYDYFDRRRDFERWKRRIIAKYLSRPEQDEENNNEEKD